MPIASSPDVVRGWATEREILLWALTPADHALLAGELAPARADGARIAVVGDGTGSARGADVAIAQPLPFGLGPALMAAGLDDVRRAGVIATAPETVAAAKRAGAGATVGIAETLAERRALLAAEPDAIVAPTGLRDLDAERFSARREVRQRLMLNPGPVVTTDRVRRAMGGPDICHREPEYVALNRRVVAKLRAVAAVGEDFDVCLLAGSGTAALELAVRGLVRPGRALLACRNGVYGERIATIAERAGLRVVSVQAEWTEPIDPAAVRDALARDRAVDAVAVVHHETTTGLLNPIGGIAAAAREAGALTMVDAISSFGGEELDARALDAICGSTNKCLHGAPGGAFALLSPAARRRARDVPPTSIYFDLPAYLDAQARGTVPYTPAVPIWLAFEAALDEVLEEGIERRAERYRERVARLDAMLGELGLEQLVAPEHRSHSIRSVHLPAGVAFADLHAAMRPRGYVVYAGQGALAAKIFRLSTMGAIELPALDGLAHDLAEVLAEVRRPEAIGA